MKNSPLVISLVLLFCFAFSSQNNAVKTELEKFRARAKIEEQNTALYRKMVEEWNKGNYEYLKEVYAVDYGFYCPSGNPKAISREENLDTIKKLREGFPDLIWSIEELVTSGDMVITRNFYRGTNTGRFQGMVPTGKRIEVSFIVMARISKGKIVEEKGEWDFMTMMKQLGSID
jgi:predicted ester cyclase